MVKLTEIEKQSLAKYPKTNITQDEFDKLPEYSMSEPTQDVSVGIKRWKRRTPVKASTQDAIWFLGEIKDGMNVFHHIVIIERSK